MKQNHRGILSFALTLTLGASIGALLVLYAGEFSFSDPMDVHHSGVLKEDAAHEMKQLLATLGMNESQIMYLLAANYKSDSHNGPTISLDLPALLNSSTSESFERDQLNSTKLLEIISSQKQLISSVRKQVDDVVEKEEQIKTTVIDASTADEVNSNTGKTFKGNPIRKFNGKRLFHKGWENRTQALPSREGELSASCTRWGVVTTIFNPSDAVRRVGNMDGWCLVIVADTKTPKRYMQEAGLENKTSTVKFLTVEEQQELANSTRAEKGMSEFVSAIPWRHFARKNLGFLFAIRNGAEYIFDFDDDNLVNLDPEGMPEKIVPDEALLKNVSVPLLGKNVFNPYPLMEPSHPDSWPRGLPLETVLDNHTRGTIEYFKDITLSKIGVIQYLADGNPDIDAVHRLTKTSPMTFAPNSNYMLVPTHAFVPYNAQATVHAKAAFWATLLPCTVPGRVSDIWRSYFAEALFREIGLQVIFGPPLVVQDRNEHDILADMQAELDLYFKAGKLVEYLDSGWKPVEEDTVPGLIEDLWIGLYERSYIGLEDVQLVQLWLLALIESGYTFPHLKQRRHRNVAIMGQFNYAIPTEQVLLWNQRWKEVFYNVVLRGAFNYTQVLELRNHGIDVYENNLTESKPGFLSPMVNLARTLIQFEDHDEVKSVLYIHDDGLLNMMDLLNGKTSLNGNEIVATDRGKNGGVVDVSYQNPRGIVDVSAKQQNIYKIHRDGTYENMKRMKFSNPKDLVGTLQSWDMYTRKECMPGQQRLAMDSASDPYREEDDSVLFSAYTQSDMLLVPTFVAQDFKNVTRLFTDSGVYLECSAGTIVDMVRSRHKNISTRILPLCTTWGGARGKRLMVEKCRQSGKLGGFIHPVKMGKGLKDWDQSFDMVTFRS